MNTRTTLASPAGASAPRADDAAFPTVAVIGLGYVGLPLAIQAASRRFPVIGFDINAEKVRMIRRRESPHASATERAALAETQDFTATDDDARLRGADIFVVCVPTPVTHGYEPDLGPLVNACRIVAKALQPGALVVIESTVNPGACEEVVLPILQKSGLAVERDFFLAHCPERINPGDERWDVATIARVVGAAGPQSLARARALYESLIDAPVVPLGSLKEAEAVKMVENAFRDVNIAFVNELAMSFDRAGIDLVNVIQGASTKPFAFLPHFPGAGVGGHCIPVDPYYLIRYGERNGFMHRFLMTARSINNRMPHYAVSLLARSLRRKRKRLARSTVALLGLAYKRDIPDVRESPATVIQSLLEKRGAIVRTYDPYVPGRSTAASLEEALADADAALIATDHREFRALTPFHFMRSGVDIVVDGRNCLSKEDFADSGVHYTGIGRANV